MIILGVGDDKQCNVRQWMKVSATFVFFAVITAARWTPTYAILRHGDSPDVTRFNYGTLFKAVQRVRLASSAWVHVLDIQLPIMPRLASFHFNLHGCATSERQANICDISRRLNITLHRLHVYRVTHVRDTIREIYVLLPSSQIRLSKRRSLLPWAGGLLSSLFGTATNSDLDAIKKHVVNLRKGVTRQMDTMHVEIDSLTSCTSILNKKLEIAKRISQVQQEAIAALNAEFQETFSAERQLESAIEIFTKHLSEYTYLATQL